MLLSNCHTRCLFLGSNISLNNLLENQSFERVGRLSNLVKQLALYRNTCVKKYLFIYTNWQLFCKACDCYMLKHPWWKVLIFFFFLVWAATVDYISCEAYDWDFCGVTVWQMVLYVQENDLSSPGSRPNNQQLTRVHVMIKKEQARVPGVNNSAHIYKRPDSLWLLRVYIIVKLFMFVILSEL